VFTFKFSSVAYKIIDEVDCTRYLAQHSSVAMGELAVRGTTTLVDSSGKASVVDTAGRTASVVDTAGRTASVADTAGRTASVAETAGSTGNSDDGSLGNDTDCGSFSSYHGDYDDRSFGSDDTGLESFACYHTDSDDVCLEDDTALVSFALDNGNPLLGLLNRYFYC
jgi:hypothetical protein